MAKYRKKPVEIEAHKFDGSSTSVGQIKHWIENGVFRHAEISTRDCGRTLEIPTLEGLMTATAGDMIIKGLAVTGRSETPVELKTRNVIVSADGKEW